MLIKFPGALIAFIKCLVEEFDFNFFCYILVFISVNMIKTPPGNRDDIIWMILNTNMNNISIVFKKYLSCNCDPNLVLSSITIFAMYLY